MKQFSQKITLIIFGFLLVQCSGDDESNPTTTNKFTYNNQDFSTQNAYLILDDQPSPYTNAFMFAFIDGEMREDNINGSSITTDNQYGLVVHVELGSGMVNAESDITNVISGTTTFSLSDDSRAILNITNYTNTYNFGGKIYGEPDDATADLHDVNVTGNGTLTINSFTVDLTVRTGTLDATYHFTDEHNHTFNGNFNGTFKIINSF